MTDIPSDPRPGPNKGTGQEEWLNPGVASVGAASLFSDAGHEMATSVLPTFLTSTLHAGPAARASRIRGFAGRCLSGWAETLRLLQRSATCSPLVIQRLGVAPGLSPVLGSVSEAAK